MTPKATFLILILFFHAGVCLGMAGRGGPYFLSKPNTYRKQVGGTVTLSCHVDNLGNSTVIWKSVNSNRIISAGEVIIRKDHRFLLTDGYNLQIRNLKKSDAGEYVCEIETYGSPLDQTNTLEILVPAYVEPQPTDGKFVVRKGSTITLSCRATGNPMPTVTWQRKNNVLPSGEKSKKGLSMVIRDVTRHHAGTYTCTANNNVGKPHTAEIDLRVLYSPEIEVDQSWIRTPDGIEAEVSCNIHSEPKAEVKWYKDTMLLDPTNTRHMEVYGNRHVLTLKKVKETDFGNYSCMADNSLGRDRGSIEVSGRPHRAKILSPNLGFKKETYNLTWTVDSFLPIEEYRILYRVNLPAYHAIEKNRPSRTSQSNRNSNKSPRFLDSQPSEWTNIIPQIPQRKDQNPNDYTMIGTSFSYTGNFVFYGLTPSTQYEVIIQSRNREGWSDATDIFRFNTRSQDYNPLEQPYQHQGYFSGSSRSILSSASLVLAICSSLLFQFI